MLRINLFGVGQMRDATGTTLNVQSRKELAALAYLLLEGDQAHSREVLQALFWPHFDTNSARNNLRVALSHLQALSPAKQKANKLFLASRTEVQLNPDNPLWVDVAEFQTLIERTRHHEHTDLGTCEPCYHALQEAAALYSAELLSGFALADCPSFEEWLFLQRERQHLLAVKAYQDLVNLAEQRSELDLALTYVQRQIAIDPLREAAYRQQMYIFARQGERSLALDSFERCRSIISSELGLDLEPETLLLHQRILSDQIPPQNEAPFTAFDPSSAPQIAIPPLYPHPLPSVSSASGSEIVETHHNLPQQLTSFIGRETELSQLRERLQAGDLRLLSLVGPGGIGKTRLALQAAGANQQFFPDGVFFVALAGVQSIDLIPAAIMAAMNATWDANAASPEEQLIKRLASQRLLLIIDNIEHLMPAVDLLLAILQSAPGVTLLVTSREQLNCQSEDIFRLSGLATPALVTLEEASKYAAVRLFCERAYRLHKTFKLTEENCSAVVKICQLVEGMPLAIELATTWLGDFTCVDLVAAITKNRSMLATTHRDLPPRHRSMQAVFDHSWHMLTGKEQQIFGQLALCRGCFSARIAYLFTGASLIDLTGLRYKSFLRIVDAGYYDLHPLIRSFSLATLDAEAQIQAEERLATLYLEYLAGQQPALEGDLPQDALRIIGRELDNIQQAWDWAVDHGRTDLLLQSAAALGGFFTATSRNAECETQFLPLVRHLLTQPDEGGDVGKLLCVTLLDKACHSLIWLGKLADALEWAKTMFSRAQASANQEYEARALMHWGKALDELAQHAEAVQKYEAALVVARQLAHAPLVGNILIELSHSFRSLGRSSETENVLLEALKIQRNQGNRVAEQRALLYLSICKREAGDFQGDRNYLIDARDLLKVTGNHHVETRLHDALGFNYGLVGSFAEALEYHESSRRIAQELNQPAQQSHALRHMCTAYRKLGNLAQAQACGLESLRLARANEMPDEIVCATFYLGLVWLAAENLPEAKRAFQFAYDGWQRQGATAKSREALVGLATVDLRSGNPAQAAQRIEPLVPALLQRVPVGVREPYEMHLACYEILRSVEDSRATAVLTTVYNQLQANLDKVIDQELLRNFWQVPAHAKIRTLWQELNG